MLFSTSSTDVIYRGQSEPPFINRRSTSSQLKAGCAPSRLNGNWPKPLRSKTELFFSRVLTRPFTAPQGPRKTCGCLTTFSLTYHPAPVSGLLLCILMDCHSMFLSLSVSFHHRGPARARVNEVNPGGVWEDSLDGAQEGRHLLADRGSGV